MANNPTIHNATALFLAGEASRLARGEITQQSYRMAVSRANGLIAEHFGSVALHEIDSDAIERFWDRLAEQRLRSTTIKAYLVVLKKILQIAARQHWIESLPRFPVVRTEPNPRGHFTVSEYKVLLRCAKDLREEHIAHPLNHRSTRGGIFTASNGVPWELVWLIGFMVNSFIRPVDARIIQHKHVEIVRNGHCYLRLRLPETKRHRNQVITLPAAVHIYESLKRYFAARTLAGPQDYLFFPHVNDRDCVTWLMDHYFGKVLEATGLRFGPRGQRRTLYSLRHSSITFRLLYGEGIDLLTLARNARTSLEMVDKFYASELSAEMNVRMLHSRRSSG